jgi:hypothetical protein
MLLVLERSSGVLLAEDVEVRLPDQFLRGAPRRVRGDPALADQQEPAQPVLEVHAFLAGQKVTHADELKIDKRPALRLLLWLRPNHDHRNPSRDLPRRGP